MPVCSQEHSQDSQCGWLPLTSGQTPDRAFWNITGKQKRASRHVFKSATLLLFLHFFPPPCSSQHAPQIPSLYKSNLWLCVVVCYERRKTRRVEGPTFVVLRQTERNQSFIVLFLMQQQWYAKTGGGHA